MDYQALKNLSKNDWKPIYELGVLRLFSIYYPNQNNPQYFFEPSQDISEDGVLTDIASGYRHPTELVRVTTEDKEAKNYRTLKTNTVSEIYPCFESDIILETLRKKVNKNYSDVNKRILIIDATECIPISWEDKWSLVAKYASSTQFHAIYAIQCFEIPGVLSLKAPHTS